MAGLSAVYRQLFSTYLSLHKCAYRATSIGLNFHGKIKLSVVLRIKFKFNPFVQIMNQKNKCI